jgi:DNA-binding NarL/FixJ family response regulator
VSSAASAVSRRVLVVDDHDAWRRAVLSWLRTYSGWEIVGEAADGVEAIEKAEALAPDLILLDVMLPRLNGIEAARHILARETPPKVLFMSTHGAWEVAETALRTGAHGYLVKGDAGRELIRAMEIVGEGGRFVSPRLAGRSVEQRHDRQADQASRYHEAVVEPDESSLVRRYALFAEDALKAGDAFVLVVNPARVAGVEQLLRTRGVDVDAARGRGRYLPVSLADALASCVIDEYPDPARVWADATGLIMRAASRLKADTRRVSACGECSPELLRTGKADAAVRLEQLWDELCLTYNLRVLCGYAAPDISHGDAFERICAIHSAVHTA